MYDPFLRITYFCSRQAAIESALPPAGTSEEEHADEEHEPAWIQAPAGMGHFPAPHADPPVFVLPAVADIAAVLAGPVPMLAHPPFLGMFAPEPMSGDHEAPVEDLVNGVIFVFHADTLPAFATNLLAVDQALYLRSGFAPLHWSAGETLRLRVVRGRRPRDR